MILLGVVVVVVVVVPFVDGLPLLFGGDESLFTKNDRITDVGLKLFATTANPKSNNRKDVRFMVILIRKYSIVVVVVLGDSKTIYQLRY